MPLVNTSHVGSRPVTRYAVRECVPSDPFPQCVPSDPFPPTPLRPPFFLSPLPGDLEMRAREVSMPLPWFSCRQAPKAQVAGSGLNDNTRTHTRARTHARHQVMAMEQANWHHKFQCANPLWSLPPSLPPSLPHHPPTLSLVSTQAVDATLSVSNL